MRKQSAIAGRTAPRKRRLRLVPIVALALGTTACAGMPTNVKRQVVVPGEVPVQLGTPARDNLTPLEAPLACFARERWKAAPMAVKTARRTNASFDRKNR